jgi:PAS domain-containing protein
MDAIHTESSYKALELEVKRLKKELYMFKKEFIKSKKDGEKEKAKGTGDKEEMLNYSIMDNMIEACIVFGDDWRYLYLNDSAVKQCRRPKNELKKKVFTEVWPGIENTKVFSLMKDCLENKISCSYVNKYEFSDNSEGWYDLKIHPVKEGILVLSNEITKQKLAEMEVEKLKKEFSFYKEGDK